MDKKKVTIAYGTVDKVELLIEDHGQLVLNIGIALQNCSYVTFGNVPIGSNSTKMEKAQKYPNEPINYAAYYISRVFKVFGVYNMKDIKGPVRVIMWNHICIGIQNYMDNNYFVPREDWIEEYPDLDLSPLNITK
jgi:hypothetical protein